MTGVQTCALPISPHEQIQIQKQAGFSYRMTTGELIYALVVARLDISFAIIKLCQYNANPAATHYQAIKHVFAYLNNTREDGLIYWRTRARNDLPDITPPPPRSAPNYRLEQPIVKPSILLVYSDSDWVPMHHTAARSLALSSFLQERLYSM